RLLRRKARGEKARRLPGDPGADPEKGRRSSRFSPAGGESGAPRARVFALAGRIHLSRTGRAGPPEDPPRAAPRPKDRGSARHGDLHRAAAGGGGRGDGAGDPGGAAGGKAPDDGAGAPRGAVARGGPGPRSGPARRMSVVVRPARALRGEVFLPGDKSLSHRILIFGALSPRALKIRNVAPGEDVRATLRCLQELGVEIEVSADEVRMRGPERLSPPTKVLDCGNSGTTMRLLAGVVAGAGLGATLDGDASLRRRPMRRVLEPLRRMGARCQGARGPDDEERAPLVFSEG